MDSLHDKISLTYEYFRSLIFKRNYNPKGIFVAWTGGKDSTSVLYLWNNFIKKEGLSIPLKAIFVDTGFTFKEIFSVIERIEKDISVDLHIYRPQVDISDYPKADVVSCCRELKINPLHTAIRQEPIEVLLTGIRGDEQSERAQRSWEEERRDPPYLQLNPILHWKESDVWTYHMKLSLPYCELYDRGYRSIDCIPCTSPSISFERDGRNPLKEEKLSILRSLGYF